MQDSRHAAGQLASLAIQRLNVNNGFRACKVGKQPRPSRNRNHLPVKVCATTVSRCADPVSAITGKEPFAMPMHTAVIGGFATAAIGALLGAGADLAWRGGQDWIAAGAVAALVVNLAGLFALARRASTADRA